MVNDACRIDYGAQAVESNPLLAQVQNMRDDQLKAAATKEFPGNEHLQSLAIKERTTPPNAPLHLQLGCYDQLSLDAARRYPGDPITQRAAVEEKMGPSNFSYGQQKLMEAHREFPNDPSLTDVAVREAKSKYPGGEPISAKEQQRLTAARGDNETAERIKEYMPKAREEFSDPRLQDIAARHMAQNSMGKLLITSEENAELAGLRQHPNDPELARLTTKSILAQTPENPQLTSDEQARLETDRYTPHAKEEFPNDPELQRLAIKQRVSLIEGQPQPNDAESAKLNAARTFRDNQELQNLLIAKQLENEPGHEKLSPEQQKKLHRAFAAREFPDDRATQDISFKERMWLDGGAEGLTRNEHRALSDARTSKLLNLLLKLE